jgi:hypothetical protein
MSISFSLGDLVQVDNLPMQKSDYIWHKSKTPNLGIVIDIFKSPTSFFDVCLSVKLNNGEIYNFSPNMLKLVIEDDRGE